MIKYAIASKDDMELLMQKGSNRDQPGCNRGRKTIV